MISRVMIFIFLFMLTARCREPFAVDAEGEASSYLVVEGYINTGPGITTIKLSRTIPISTDQVPPAETNAVVMVEDENLTQYILREEGEGKYSADLDLPADKTYRIHIFTKNGKEYLSELQKSIATPPIDLVTWHYSERGVDILLSTHDELNATRYYQFDFEETWEVYGFYASHLKYQGKQIIPRSMEESQAMYQCWKSNTPSDLILHSTAQQESDITTDFPIMSIPPENERLDQKYSILVKTRALTIDNYQFLQLMKKNTGPLGSFSDPQPSELIGNIRCTTTDELVVAHIGVSTTSQQRIFIYRWDLPEWNYDLHCELRPTRNHPDTLAKYLTRGDMIPTTPTKFGPDGEIEEFYRARDICVDCRRLGGNNVKPDFWD